MVSYTVDTNHTTIYCNWDSHYRKTGNEDKPRKTTEDPYSRGGGVWPDTIEPVLWESAAADQLPGTLFVGITSVRIAITLHDIR